MTRPVVASRAEWLAARTELLAEEKAVTRAQDALAARRRALPMVPVPEYVFEGPDGRVRLAEVFGGRRQLIVYHLMWQWDLDEGCPGCAGVLDEIGGLALLPGRDTAFAAVSRGPWERLAGYHAGHGWPFPVLSSFGSDFNYDFHASLDADIAPVRYNYRSAKEQALAGHPLPDEQPGVSVFWRDDDDAVFHTYSAYARGIDPLRGAQALLDLTPLGRPR